MDIHKPRVLPLACAALALVCLMVIPARADEAQEDDSGWYLDAGVSVYVVDLPDWAPLWQFNYTAGPLSDGPGKRQALIDEPVVTPLLQATLGTELADRWFVEARGEYADTEPSDRNSYTPDSEYEYVGYFPLNGNHAPAGTRETTFVRTDFTFQEYGLSLVAGKTLAWDQVQARLFTGYWFREMNLDYAYDLYTSTDPAHIYLDESLETTYHGALVGLGLDWRWNEWSLEVETTHGLAWAHTNYHGCQTDTAIIGWTEERDLDKDETAYRGTLEATLSIPLDHGWDFGFTAGVRFLSYVPEIMASGTGTVFDMEGDGDPTHLESATSFSGTLGVEFGYSF